LQKSVIAIQPNKALASACLEGPKAELAIETLDKPIAARWPVPGRVIHHSDRLNLPNATALTMPNALQSKAYSRA
jgi:hypothetical protein